MVRNKVNYTLEIYKRPDGAVCLLNYLTLTDRRKQIDMHNRRYRDDCAEKYTKYLEYGKEYKRLKRDGVEDD